MPSVNAFPAPSFFYSTRLVANGAESIPDDYLDVRAGWHPDSPLVMSSFSDNTPIEMTSQSVQLAYSVPGLETDWFNRIHLISDTVSGGAVPSYKEETFYVWDAYLRDDIVYEVIHTPTSGDGLTLSGDYATPWNRLELREFTIEFSALGDITIDSTFTFVFLGESATVSVTGFRISVFPFWPQTPVDEELKPASWIFTAKDGTEQRSKSIKWPRRKYGHTYLIDIDYWRMAQNLLNNRAGGRWAVFHAAEAQIKHTSYAVNQTAVTIQTDFGEFYSGGLVVFWKNPNEWHISEIASLDSNGIVLSTPFQSALSGEIFVAPVSTGRENGKINVKKDPAGNHTIGMEFNVYDGMDLTVQIEPRTYLGYNFLDRANEGKSVSDEIVQNVYSNDYDLGLVDWGARWTYPKVKRSYKWTLEDMEDLWWFRLFVHEHGGHKPFWIPSFERDLEVASAIGGGSATISVTDDEFRLSGYPMKEHIRIIYADGSEDLRKINSVADAGSGVTVLTLSSNTSNIVSQAADTVRVEFVCLVRIDGSIKITELGYRSEAVFDVVEVKA